MQDGDELDFDMVIGLSLIDKERACTKAWRDVGGKNNGKCLLTKLSV